jgi:hypothetical protein
LGKSAAPKSHIMTKNRKRTVLLRALAGIGLVGLVVGVANAQSSPLDPPGDTVKSQDVPFFIVRTWKVPPACPSRSELAARINRLLRGGNKEPRPGETIEIDGAIRTVGRSYALSLELRTNQTRTTREFSASGCEAITDAAALLVALTIDPQLATINPNAGRNSQGLDAGSGVAVVGGDNDAAGNAVGDAAGNNRPSDATETADSSARADDADSEQGKPDARAPDAQYVQNAEVIDASPPPPSIHPTERPTAVVNATEAQASSAWFADVRIGFDTALLPRTTFLIGGSLGYERGLFRAFVAGLGTPISSTAETTSRLSGSFSLLQGSLNGCLAPNLLRAGYTRIHGGACLGLAAGYVRAEGTGADRTSDDARLLPLGVGTAHLQVRYRTFPLVPAFWISGAVPFTRPNYEIAGTFLHRAPSASLQAGFTLQILWDQ